MFFVCRFGMGPRYWWLKHSSPMVGDQVNLGSSAMCREAAITTAKWSISLTVFVGPLLRIDVLLECNCGYFIFWANFFVNLKSCHNRYIYIVQFCKKVLLHNSYILYLYIYIQGHFFLYFKVIMFFYKMWVYWRRNKEDNSQFAAAWLEVTVVRGANGFRWIRYRLYEILVVKYRFRSFLILSKIELIFQFWAGYIDRALYPIRNCKTWRNGLK